MTRCNNTSGLKVLEKKDNKNTKAYQSICIFYSHMLHFALNVIKSHPFRDDIIKSESAPTVMYCITACLTSIHHKRRHQHYPPVTQHNCLSIQNWEGVE